MNLGAEAQTMDKLFWRPAFVSGVHKGLLLLLQFDQ
jgi:hypothetical protein